MRISDWSSDVCSSDLGIDRFLRFVTAPTCCRRLCEAGSGCERTKMSHYPALELLIAGERLSCEVRETIDVLDPATGEVFAALPKATPADLDAALEATARGFTAWRTTSADQREDRTSVV